MAQVVILSFALILAVVLRIILCPHHYLEPFSIYVLVAFFFFTALVQFALYTRFLEENPGMARIRFKKRLWCRIAFSLAIGALICLTMVSQPVFFACLYLLFLLLELIFDWVYYPRLFSSVYK